MENEDNSKDIIIIKENEGFLDNIFKFDYLNKKIDNNIKYQKWKKLMINKYGKNAKFV